MKIKHLLVSLLASAALFAGCQDEEKDLGLPEVKITQNELSFDQNVGTSTVTVYATRDWTVSTSADWLAFTPSKGKAYKETAVTVTALANEGYNRTAAVKFDIGYDYKTLTVTQEGPLGEKTEGSGTLEDPYTVKGVLAYIQSLGVDESPEVVYVSGKVATITESYTAQYGNATFTINDSGTEGEAVFTAYRVKYLGNKAWTANDSQIEVGDEVIVAGKVYNYGGKTPETVSNTGYLYSHNGKTAGGGSTGTPEGDGTAENPYNVAAIIQYTSALAADTNSDPLYFKGVVVGNPDINTSFGNATFYIGDSADDASTFYVFRSFYLNNAKYTSADQLKAGDEVVIYGPVVNYKGNTPETVASKAYLYTLNGSGDVAPIDDDEDVIFSESFAASQGDFTINNVNLPSEVEAVWTYASQYSCMKATAFVNPTNYASESWLVSPEIDLSSETSAYLSFEHAGNYFAEGKVESEVSVKISTDGTSWTNLEIKNYFSGWTFVSSGEIDLTAYLGNKVQIAFCYSSTAEKAGTWEVKNVKVYRTAVPEPDPVDPVEGETKTITLAATDFTADTDATYGTGFKYETDGYTIAYYKHASPSNPVNTHTDHIRVYKNSVIVITAPEGVTMKALTFNCTYADKTYEMNVLEGGGTTTADTSAKTVKWTGSANKFIGQTVNGQCQFKSIDIIYE